MDKQRYMISDAAAAVNVESHVLRYWEEELELAVPRNEMGHRYYTKENINQFLKIKELKEKGYQLKAIKMILHSENPEGLDIGQMSPEQLNAQAAGITMEQLNARVAALSMEHTNSRGAGSAEHAEAETGVVYSGGQAYVAQAQGAMGVKASGYQGQTKLDQFQEMMTQIVKEAIAENNRALGKEVGEQVGDRVLKEMNYLMREQDEQEEERYRKLDEAIRGIHKKKEKKNSRLFGKKQAPQPKQA